MDVYGVSIEFLLLPRRQWCSTFGPLMYCGVTLPTIQFKSDKYLATSQPLKGMIGNKCNAYLKDTLSIRENVSQDACSDQVFTRNN